VKAGVLDGGAKQRRRLLLGFSGRECEVLGDFAAAPAASHVAARKPVKPGRRWARKLPGPSPICLLLVDAHASCIRLSYATSHADVE
jgi:hypothetical protein